MNSFLVQNPMQIFETELIMVVYIALQGSYIRSFIAVSISNNESFPIEQLFYVFPFVMQ